MKAGSAYLSTNRTPAIAVKLMNSMHSMTIIGNGKEHNMTYIVARLKSNYVLYL